MKALWHVSPSAATQKHELINMIETQARLSGLPQTSVEVCLSRQASTQKSIISMKSPLNTTFYYLKAIIIDHQPPSGPINASGLAFRTNCIVISNI